MKQEEDRENRLRASRQRSDQEFEQAETERLCGLKRQSLDDLVNFDVAEYQVTLILESLAFMKRNDRKLASETDSLTLCSFYALRADNLEIIEDSLANQLEQHYLGKDELSVDDDDEPEKVTMEPPFINYVSGGLRVFPAKVENMGSKEVYFEHNGHYNLKAYMDIEDIGKLKIHDSVYVEIVDYDFPVFIVAPLSPEEVEQLNLPRLK